MGEGRTGRIGRKGCPALALYNPIFAVSQTAAAPERRKARRRGGKSELRRAVRRLTPGQGNLKDSGTENIPPALAGRQPGEGE